MTLFHNFTSGPTSPSKDSPVPGTRPTLATSYTATERLWCPSCGTDGIAAVGNDILWCLACSDCGWRSPDIEDAFTSAQEVLVRYKEAPHGSR